MKWERCTSDYILVCISSWKLQTAHYYVAGNISAPN